MLFRSRPLSGGGRIARPPIARPPTSSPSRTIDHGKGALMPTAEQTLAIAAAELGYSRWNDPE